MRVAAAVAAAGAAVALVGTVLHWSDADAGPRTTPQVEQLFADHSQIALAADWTGTAAFVAALVALIAAVVTSWTLRVLAAGVAAVAAAAALVTAIVATGRLDEISSDGRTDGLTKLGVAYPAGAGLYLSLIGAAIALVAAVAAIVLGRRRS
jgi:hypothetical protein